ncbi:hypothetical protein SME38J_04900 [Serratia marcescens]|nr:hypothetical protein SME38J_04900 [Serratia marcescens]
MKKMRISAGKTYRDRNFIVVRVHSIDLEKETVTYSQLTHPWTITAPVIIFQSRFFRIDDEQNI